MTPATRSDSHRLGLPLSKFCAWYALQHAVSPRFNATTVEVSRECQVSKTCNMNMTIKKNVRKAVLRQFLTKRDALCHKIESKGMEWSLPWNLDPRLHAYLPNWTAAAFPHLIHVSKPYFPPFQSQRSNFQRFWTDIFPWPNAQIVPCFFQSIIWVGFSIGRINCKINCESPP